MDINYILSKSNKIKKAVRNRKEYRKKITNIYNNALNFFLISTLFTLLTIFFFHGFKINLNNIYYFCFSFYLINIFIAFYQYFDLINGFKYSKKKEEKDLKFFIESQELEINKKGESLSYYNIIYNVFSKLNSEDIKKIKLEKINCFLSKFNIEEKFILSNILSLKIKTEQKKIKKIKENLSIIK